MRRGSRFITAALAPTLAVGSDGNATAVRAQNDRLWTTATGLTTEPPAAPAAARRDYVGADGFPGRVGAGGKSLHSVG